MIYIIQKIKNRILSGDERSSRAKINILLSVINKCVAVLIGLMLIPITIDYLDPEQYGIWLTLSSIVAWISYFNVGLGHGFRNRFAEAKAKGQVELCRKYVSTTYFALFVIFGIVAIVFEFFNPLINWSAILNVNPEINALLCDVVAIALIGVCTQFVLAVFPILLEADQRPAFSAMLSTSGQAIALLVILVLTMIPFHSMKYIAVALTWVPCLVVLVFSACQFRTRYKRYAPSIKLIELSLVRNIVGLGGKFFVIQVSMLLIFQTVNIIISRVLGPSYVTEYNVAYKYFSITMMVFNIAIAPYWSAFTDAYVKGDFDWMRGVTSKLSRIWLALVFVSVILLAVSPISYKIWLHGSVNISWSTSIGMAVYVNIMALSTMYMTLINGTGKIMLQMMLYGVLAVMSIPICLLLCEYVGIVGILMVLSTVYASQAILGKMQLRKVLNSSATGIWDK